MIIKVCGITNAGDALSAIDAGATAIGFNFYPRSPRYLAPERAAEIDTRGVRRIGVFVNESPARIAEIARIAALDTAQLHGDESPAEYPNQLAVWKAARVAAGGVCRLRASRSDSPLQSRSVLDRTSGAFPDQSWSSRR